MHIKPQSGHAIPPGIKDVLEFIEAGRRIMRLARDHGEDPRRAALAWLVMFAHEDLLSLDEKKSLDRWWEIGRFAWDAGLMEEALRGRTMMTTVGSVSLSNPTDTTEVLHDLADRQKSIRRIVQRWREKGEVRISLPHLHLTITKTAKRPRRTVDAEDLETGLRFQAAEILADCGDLIRECRGCNVVFVAGRKDKEFCSKNCQAKIYKREHKKRGGKADATKR